MLCPNCNQPVGKAQNICDGCGIKLEWDKLQPTNTLPRTVENPEAAYTPPPHAPQVSVEQFFDQSHLKFNLQTRPFEIKPTDIVPTEVEIPNFDDKPKFVQGPSTEIKGFAQQTSLDPEFIQLFEKHIQHPQDYNFAPADQPPLPPGPQQMGAAPQPHNTTDFGTYSPEPPPPQAPQTPYGEPNLQAMAGSEDPGFSPVDDAMHSPEEAQATGGFKMSEAELAQYLGKTPWYYSFLFVSFMTLFCGIGFLLCWKSPWPIQKKIVFTVVALVLIIVLGLFISIASLFNQSTMY